jgi:hypothetical protein
MVTTLPKFPVVFWNFLNDSGVVVTLTNFPVSHWSGNKSNNSSLTVQLYTGEVQGTGDPKRCPNNKTSKNA